MIKLSSDNHEFTELLNLTADDEKRKYPISFREGFTVFLCLGLSLAAIMALVIYVGFFWYLEQQRQLKGKKSNGISNIRYDFLVESCTN